MVEVDVFAYFTPLCIFIFILVCFLQFAVRGSGCCGQLNGYPIRRRRVRPDQLIWNTACASAPSASMMASPYGIPAEALMRETFPIRSPGYAEPPNCSNNHFHEAFARQVAQGQAIYTPDLWELDARRLLGCPPKYEDAMKDTSPGAPPEYLGETASVGWRYQPTNHPWQAEVVHASQNSPGDSSASHGSSRSISSPHPPIENQTISDTSCLRIQSGNESIHNPISRSLSNGLPDRGLGIPENHLNQSNQRSQSCHNVVIINMDP